MIFWIIQFLISKGIRVPAVFEYTSTRMLLAAVTALIFCIFVGPFFIRKLYELKIGQTIRKEECPLLGELHEKKQDTPTMGGILILSGMLLSLFLWMDFGSIFTWLLLLTTLALGALGGRDDYLKLKYKNVKGVSPKKKLLYQAIVAFVVVAYMSLSSVAEEVKWLTGISPPVIKVESKERLHLDPFFALPEEKTAVTAPISIKLQDFAARLYAPFFKEPLWIFHGVGLIAMFLFMMFVIVGSSNAVNLTDGLDGLAAGCLIMVASVIGFVAFLSNNLDISRYLHIPYIEGSSEIAVYMAAFGGACLGFLWYNSHPAQLFMGDIGSLTLGGVIGVSAVLLKKEILLGIVGGIFVAEALSVILQVGSYRLRNKKRIFLCAPLHHHFEYRGWAETKVVIRFWIVALLLALLSVGSLKFQ